MIEGLSKLTRSASSYTTWIFSCLWRRKTSLLAVIGLIVLALVCLQYNVTKELVEITWTRQEGDVDDSVKLVDGLQNHDHRLPLLTDEHHYFAREPVVDVVGHSYEDDFMAESNLGIQREKGLEIGLPYVPKHRLVHLDLKGAPPKISYLQKLLPMFKELGATGILLEWEDMFPWQDKLKHLAAKNAFSREEAREILAMAQKCNLEVIPAIQTFGHVEFALKNKEFIFLREVEESPQSLCPSLNASFELVQEMIDQVMQVHADINFLHIGCDEVLHLGECARCRLKIKDELFLSYVSQIAQYIRKKYMSVVPIIWDDMLRHVPLSSLELYNFNKLVEPMIWVYAEDVYRFVPQTVWEKYQSVFAHTWTASAFKGAFGETFYVPNVKRHLDNNMNWLSLMSVEDSRFEKGFRGMAITGWQRYDHFATLCETLPASIPSLVVNLVAVSHGYANDSLKETIRKGLNCGIVSGVGSYMRDVDLHNQFLNLNDDPFLWEQFSRCMFSGSQFYRLLYRWHSLEREVKEYLTVVKEKKAWMTEYNIRRNYSVPFRVNELMMEHNRLYYGVLSILQSVNDALKDVFNKYTIAEWIEQNLYPVVLELERIYKVSKNLKSRHTWPRRPLPPLVDLQKIGVTVLSNSSKLTDSLVKSYSHT